MAWGFIEWARGKPYRPDIDQIVLPPNPSPVQVERIALMLLDPPRSYDACKALRTRQHLARPVVEKLLRSDRRFRDMSVELPAWRRPVLDVILTILFEWESDYAEKEAIRLADSSDAALRAIAARLLASTGDARFAPLLLKLTRDTSENVRRAAGYGLNEVSQYGRQRGRSLDTALTLALYEYLLESVLRTDRGPGVGFARLMFQCDRNRAVIDLDPERVLKFELTWLDDLLRTFAHEGIAVEPTRLSKLFDDCVAFFDRADFAKHERPGIDSLAADLACMIHRNDAGRGKAALARLRSHACREARNSAQRAREQLSANPVKVALESLRTSGMNLPSRTAHRVVHLAWKLDAEVTNGGWLQWVANSSGGYAVETLAALEAIGANVAAGELRKVIAILGSEGTSDDQSVRMAAIDRLLAAGRSLPDEHVLWETSPELRSLIYDYAEAHSEAFPGNQAGV